MSNEQAALSGAAAALRLPLEDLACDRLFQYLALLRKWNRVYNLTAVHDAQEMLVRHLFDSLAVVQPLRRELLRRPVDASGDGIRLLDVGSGAGLPGIVLAICCPDLLVSCIDAVAKKAAFVQQVALELSLVNLRSIQGRVETLQRNDGPAAYDIISSRAFASLKKFTACSSHLLADQGIWLAMKGKFPQREIDELPNTIEMFHVEPLCVPQLDEQRCIVWMRKKHARSAGAALRQKSAS